MIVNDRITDYIKSLEPGEAPLIHEIGKKARENGVPVIREETAAFLKTMTAAMNPKAILEVGTAVGYSALLMAQVMAPDCHITTIEKYEKRIPEARSNFEKAGETNRITLLEGDAQELLKGLCGPFDLVFMDAAKGQYLAWLPRILELMRTGGMLISDNVLQDGDIIESRYTVERRNRTIHGRMREYLYELKHSPFLTTAIVPIGDGITVSIRK
ncbi:O-methyltransferase [Lacrimispora sp.]|uniref:O-methyltransferase n=1 Tax=Lacrimispora sp. TaxID=2719234 RepID=UPI003993B67E